MKELTKIVREMVANKNAHGKRTFSMMGEQETPAPEQCDTEVNEVQLALEALKEILNGDKTDNLRGKLEEIKTRLENHVNSING